MHRFAALAILLVLCAPSFVAAPAAGGAATRRLPAITCGVLPSPVKVDVQVLDNDERHLKFRDRFIAALRANGGDAVNGADAILTLEVRTEREFQRRAGGELIELRAGQENTNIGGEGTVFFRGNIWSSTSDSVLGGRKRDRRHLSLNRLQVTATVNSRKTGRCLWQGEVINDLEREDADPATARILPILAQSVGKAVRNQAIDIDP